MAKTTPEQPVAAPQSAPAVKAKRSLEISPNLISFIVVVAALGYVLYGSWRAFEEPVTTDAPQVAATPAIPALKLNQENKRNAPEITVDEEGIGKDNPFAQ